MLATTFFVLVAMIAMGFLARYVGNVLVAVSGTLVAVWALFAVFTLYFFRDPNPTVPAGAR